MLPLLVKRRWVRLGKHARKWAKEKAKAQCEVSQCKDTGKVIWQENV